MGMINEFKEFIARGNVVDLAVGVVIGADLGASGLDTPVWVRTDALLMQGVLYNLIDNALRYATTGTAPRITVALSVQGDQATLEVLDNDTKSRAFALVILKMLKTAAGIDEGARRGA